MIHLDHQAQHAPDPDAISLYQKHMQQGLLELPYQDQTDLYDLANRSIESIRDCVGARDDAEVIFTSGRGEGVATVLQTALFQEAFPKGKNHIMTVSTEEADILLTLDRLKSVGIEPQIAVVNSLGHLNADILDLFSSPRTSLLSLSWANRHTGVVQPIWEIAEYCKAHNILLHVDVSDVIGKLFLSAGDLPIDFITFEGSRIGAPLGTGALICQTECAPLIPTGDPSLRRGGPLNLAGLASLGLACAHANDRLQHVCMETARLKHDFEEQIRKRIPDVHILFEQCDRLPTTSVIAFEHIHHEALLHALWQNGVVASMGGGDAQHLEPLLGVCGVMPEIARGALSFCLNSQTTQDEIDAAVKIIESCVNSIRKIAGKLVEEADV